MGEDGGGGGRAPQQQPAAAGSAGRRATAVASSLPSGIPMPSGVHSSNRALVHTAGLPPLQTLRGGGRQVAQGATQLPMPAPLHGGLYGGGGGGGGAHGGGGGHGHDHVEEEIGGEEVPEEVPEDDTVMNHMEAVNEEILEEAGHGIHEEIEEDQAEEHQIIEEDGNAGGGGGRLSPRPGGGGGHAASAAQQQQATAGGAAAAAAAKSVEYYPADFDEDDGIGAEEGIGADGDGGGGPAFRLVYSGGGTEYLMTDLTPACRYRFRVRRLHGDTPTSGWSEVLVLETDATDSAHRIDFDDIMVHEVLGEGAFSVVYRGLFCPKAKQGEAPTDGSAALPQQGRQVAVKRLKYQHLNEELVSKFSVEVAILSRVRHRNAVGFVGAVTEQPNLCIVMEYMDAGSLHQAIHKQNLVLPLPRLLQVAMDVAQGCHYLHRQKPMIIHRDLKSQNILLTQQGVAKIADFGLSRFFQQDVASMTGQVGTPGWTAPEVYKHNSYNHKVDVYSFAVVLAECLSCEKPYAGMDAMQIAFATVYRNKRPSLPPSAPPPLEKLIKCCWDSEPKKRPPFSRIIDQLRAIERSTCGVSKSVDRGRGTGELSSREGGGGGERNGGGGAGGGGGGGANGADGNERQRTTSAGVNGRRGAESAGDGAYRAAARPKGSAHVTSKVDTGRGGADRAGSPDRSGRLRRQIEKGAASSRVSNALADGLSERTGGSDRLRERTTGSELSEPPLSRANNRSPTRQLSARRTLGESTR